MSCTKNKTGIIHFEQPTVVLKSYTKNPIQQIINALRVCRLSESDSVYEHDGFGDIDLKLGPKDESLIKKEIEAGHTTCLEMIDFTFYINLSTVSHKHLIRHRISSFAAESQRFVVPDTAYKPKKIEECDKLNEMYFDAILSAFKSYHELIRCGASIDEARYVLPEATMGAILYKTNLRSLRNAIGLRTCRHAVSEIQSIFKEISKIVRNVHPILLHSIEKYVSCKAKENCGYCQKEN